MKSKAVFLFVSQLRELFEAFAEAFNVKPTDTKLIVFYILAGGFITYILRLLFSLCQKIVLIRNRKGLSKDLFPFFTNNDIYRATKFFINTKYQNVSPAEDEEPGRIYIASAKNLLIPLFLDKVFPFGKEASKYNLILADTGMGKTTFMVNLYLKYKNKWKNPFSPKHFDIQLIPIWHNKAAEKIKNIQNKQDTILLLDAFDEDILAVKDYKLRLNSLLKEIEDFRIIVITCRTQFFPSQKEEPHDTGYFSAGESGQYKFQKLYLSVFDDKDVKKYLKKQFSIFERSQYLKAKK